MFAGWQTAALKANRKPLLWPWPWGACLRSGLGPGAAALKAIESHCCGLGPGVPVGKWPWPWGACWGRCLEGLDVLEGLDGFGGCLEEGLGVWRVLEGV